jgi:protein YibB
MKQPIIVTAFWDVGRSENCQFPRSNEKYYREFAEWARIKNTLIVYTDENSEKEIKKIRAEYGLSEKTIVIVLKDFWNIEKKAYQKMCKIENDRDFIDFRYRPEAMENRANFVYAWYMKYWCLADAVKYTAKDDVFAWFDFGFNHINVCYTNMKEFDFIWKLNRNVDKIQVFSLVNTESISSLSTLQFMEDSIMGVFHIVPVKCAVEFWNTIREAMEALLTLGCIDDDQELILIASKNYPELIEVNVCRQWYLPLKEWGASHLSTREIEIDHSIKHKIWKWRYLKNHRDDYIKKTTERLNKNIRM